VEPLVTRLTAQHELSRPILVLQPALAITIMAPVAEVFAPPTEEEEQEEKWKGKMEKGM